MDVAMKLDFDSCDDEEVNTSFHTLSSGCDVEDGSEFSSDDLTTSKPPSPPTSRLFSPRKCRPAANTHSSKTEDSSPQQVLDSPPYKKIRALRLFDSPATPKTLLQKSSAAESSASKANPRLRLFPAGRPRHSRPMAWAVPATPPPPPPPPQPQEKEAKAVVMEVANINPFTPTGMLLSSRKRTRSRRELDGSPRWV